MGRKKYYGFKKPMEYYSVTFQDDSWDLFRRFLPSAQTDADDIPCYRSQDNLRCIYRIPCTFLCQFRLYP